ncbi:MAG: NAD-dependent epimerase/dehydratase family protein [Chloroflexi bacterium]|nr:MAG: NAD-dependent epimerase/dehydratase family protein [Chloroflexota bacterium]
MPRRFALVTGGAGLIGSHLVDLLVAEGWKVRVLDNLEPQTHSRGEPGWLNPGAEFVLGDVRDPAALGPALDTVDTVFHLAAYGGYMPEIGKFIDVNSLGTARLLEVIRDRALPVRKLIVASSQAVYIEGSVSCPVHGTSNPPPRAETALAAGRFAVPCPVCGRAAESVPTPESAPIGGETVYALTKLDQERLTLNWSRQVGIPAVALRFACTYGPRQSLFNPYTGVIAVFCSRLVNGLPPILYEDGEQTRDLCYVGDVARACLLAAESHRLDGLAVNIGTGYPTSVRRLAEVLLDLLDSRTGMEIPGAYRPGEMRALTPDIAVAVAAGYEPTVTLEEGLVRYVAWLSEQGPIEERFGESLERLRRLRLVHSVAS